MTVLDQLSSRTGDRTEASNRAVADRCLAEPALLAEIATALSSEDVALAGDSAEVMTLVAAGRPELVAPYAQRVAILLASKNTRARWEAMHSLALVATLAPQAIAFRLPHLGEMIRHDNSRIVRDYAVQAVGNYAGTGPLAARQAFPILKMALSAWDGKHAAGALQGLAKVAGAASMAPEIRAAAEPYTNDSRAAVRRAAKQALRAAEGK